MPEPNDHDLTEGLAKLQGLFDHLDADLQTLTAGSRRAAAHVPTPSRSPAPATSAGNRLPRFHGAAAARNMVGTSASAKVVNEAAELHSPSTTNSSSSPLEAIARLERALTSGPIQRLEAGQRERNHKLESLLAQLPDRIAPQPRTTPGNADAPSLHPGSGPPRREPQPIAIESGESSSSPAVSTLEDRRSFGTVAAVTGLRTPIVRPRGAQTGLGISPGNSWPIRVTNTPTGADAFPEATASPFSDRFETVSAARPPRVPDFVRKTAGHGNDAGATRLLRAAVQLAEKLGATLERHDPDGITARWT